MAANRAFKGKVILVGAGPGDPGLITVRGREILQHADVVVFDHLVAKELVDLAPAAARRIYVGKKVGKHTLRQDEINELLLQEAKAGAAVVRLKGGDPFIFGRGAEECEYLRQGGVEFEVVPGISAAAAVPAYAGIPVTCRHLSASFIAVTGHEDASKEESAVNWPAIAKIQDTLVIFMGVLKLRKITATLIQHGRAPDTPTAVIRWGTYAHQRTLTGTLGDIAAKVERAHLRPPALIVIGDAVRLRDRLNWFETRPLFGRTIILPRARSQKSRLAALLKEKGANVVEIPAARHEPIAVPDRISDTLRHISGFDWIIFPGAASAELFFSALNQIGQDSRHLSRCRIGALDEETTDVIQAHGIRPDFLANRFCSSAVIGELAKQYPLEGMRVLIPSRNEIPEGLTRAFQNAGAIVETVISYKGEEEESDAIALNGHKLDAAAFTCSKTVSVFFERLGVEEAKRMISNATVASIGPQTSNKLREFGVPVHIQAPESNIPSLAAALAAHYCDDTDKD